MYLKSLLGILLLIFAQESFAAKFKCQKTVLGGKQIVVISGTTRDGSNTYRMSQIVTDQLRGQLEGDSDAYVEMINLVDWHDERTLEHAEWLRSDRSTPRPDYWNTSRAFKDNYEVPIAMADAIVIIHPEYNNALNGDLKTFLDLLSIRSFKNHQIFTISIAAGQLGGMVPDEQLHTTLSKRGAAYSSEHRLGIAKIEQFFFADGEEIENPQVSPRAIKFINRIADSL